MQQVNQIIDAFWLNRFDESFMIGLFRRQRWRNSEVILALIAVLFVVNTLGFLRWFSQGLFVFLLPAWYTLREYKAARILSYSHLLCYWMLVAGLLQVESDLYRVPLF